MSPGEDVIFIADPLAYGVMQVVGVLYNGRVQCESHITGVIHAFDPHALESYMEVAA